MQARLIKKLSNSVRPKHYFALLGSVLGLTILAPLFEDVVWARLIVGAILFASLLTATLAVKSASRLSAIAMFLAFLSGIMWVLALCDPQAPFNGHTFQIAAYAASLLFFIITCFIILKDVFSGAITSNKICGAVCVYLLTGFCFAMIHMMIAIADPNSYHNDIATTEDTNAFKSSHSWFKRYPLFVYFSFCTFSTVGYGDVIPVSRLARAISSVEATFGQLYLAVLIARLVGLHTASLSMRRAEKMAKVEERETVTNKRD